MNRRNFLKGFLASGAVIALAPLKPIVDCSIVQAEFKVSFDEIARITLEKYRPVFADLLMGNIRKQNYFYNTTCFNGGKVIVEPLLLN